MEKRVLLLSNNDNIRSLYEWLQSLEEYDIKLHHEPVTLEMIKEFRPDLAVSFNYQHIVKEDVIHYLGDKIINMHTSLLPWKGGLLLIYGVLLIIRQKV